MQLKIGRSESKGGLFGNKTKHELTFSGMLNPEEAAFIKSLKCASTLVYMETPQHADYLHSVAETMRNTPMGDVGEYIVGNTKFSLDVIDLANGKRFTTTDINEAMRIEAAVKKAARDFVELVKARSASSNGEDVLDIT